MHETMTRLYDAVKSIKNVTGQSAVAALLGESPQTVNNWEKRGLSKAGKLKAQEIIECSATWLTTGKGAMRIQILADADHPAVARVILNAKAEADVIPRPVKPDDASAVDASVIGKASAQSAPPHSQLSPILQEAVRLMQEAEAAGRAESLLKLMKESTRNDMEVLEMYHEATVGRQTDAINVLRGHAKVVALGIPEEEKSDAPELSRTGHPPKEQKAERPPVTPARNSVASQTGAVLEVTFLIIIVCMTATLLLLGFTAGVTASTPHDFFRACVLLGATFASVEFSKQVYFVPNLKRKKLFFRGCATEGAFK